MEAARQPLLRCEINESLIAWGFTLFDFRFEKDWLKEKCIPSLICDMVQRLYLDKTDITEINCEKLFDLTAWNIGLH